MPLEYYQCPYCKPWTSETRNVPHTVGKFRIKTADSVWLVLQCVRCNKTFKIKTQGNRLLWSDMSSYEKRMFIRRKK